jgi:transcriptional regulator with XRE-family HTH domain
VPQKTRYCRLPRPSLSNFPDVIGSVDCLVSLHSLHNSNEFLYTDIGHMGREGMRTTAKSAQTTKARPPAIERSEPGALGQRLRALRIAKGVGVRQLAEKVGVSASLISQIELGKGAPSVKTLYGLVKVLDVPMAVLFETDPSGQSTRPWRADGNSILTNGGFSKRYVQDGANRRAIGLEHGFRWESLTPTSDPSVEFIELIIGVGGGAKDKTDMKTHQGREYGVVLRGQLGIAIAFETYTLKPRDSISFESTIPHCMWNAGRDEVHAIWMNISN